MESKTKRNAVIIVSSLIIISVGIYIILPKIQYKIALKYLSDKDGYPQSAYSKYQPETIINRYKAFKNGSATYLDAKNVKYQTLTDVKIK